jgi:hypothetical protein
MTLRDTNMGHDVISHVTHLARCHDVIFDVRALYDVTELLRRYDVTQSFVAGSRLFHGSSNGRFALFFPGIS